MTIKVGILGTGWGAQVQVPAFRQAGLKIVGLWGRTEEKSRKIAADLAIPFSTADDEALISRAGVDLISIVTPPHTHAELAIAALEAGKHVLCEKPTALNADQAEQMLAAAAAHPGQIALIDHELRFLPTRQKMRALIQQGYVGEVYYVEGTNWSGGLLSPGRKWNWWSEAEKGGGVLGNFGSHVIDALTWLLDRPVRAVNATSRTFISERNDAAGMVHPVTSDDFTALHLRFDGGISGEVQLSSVVAGPTVHRLLVAGSEGSLLYENSRLAGFRTGARTPEDLTVEEHTELPRGMPDSEWSRGTIYMGRALRAALETGDRSALWPAATFADGLHVQQVLDAAKESNESGNWVRILSENNT